VPFPLLDLQGLLLPVDLLQLEVRRLRDAQPTAEHDQKQGAIHWMVDVGKEPLDLLPGERFRQGPPASDETTGLDGIARDELLVETKVKKMLERIEPPGERRPRAAVVMLYLGELIDLAEGYLGEGDGNLGKEEAHIYGITRDSVRREPPSLQIGPKAVDGGLADVIHGLSPI
jgi:hypothetical protein